MKKTIHLILGTVLTLHMPPRRDERGLSQSTENAILLAGAVGIALVITTTIGKYVADNLPG